MTTAPPPWIGSPPTRSQSFAAMMVGITGVMIAGLQPQLLGALQEEGRLTAAQLGHAATGELLTMGAAVGLAGAWLKPTGLRWIGLACGLLLAVLDALSTRVSGELITLVRAAAGVPSGVMIWITSGMISRAPRPERWSGVFLTLQTLAQFALASLLTAAVIGPFGANGGWWALAGLGVLAAGIALAVPPAYAPLAHADGPGGLPPARGWVALAVGFLFLACIVGIWVYAEPLSRQAGHAPNVVGMAVSISLGCQVLGGAAATLLAGRVPWFWTLLGCSVLDLGLLALIGALPGPGLFLFASGLFGFVWLFVLPFLVPMTIEADPTRRTSVLLGGAQLLGASLGPLIASLVVTDTDARGAVVFGAVALAAAMVLVTALHLRPHREP